MKDRTYEVLIALLCVALAVAGIYYLTADSPIWNEWKSDERPSTEAPPDPTASSGRQIDERLPSDESQASTQQPPAPGPEDQVVTKQAPGEEIDVRPPESQPGPGSEAPSKTGGEAPPASGKELTDRIPESES